MYIYIWKADNDDNDDNEGDNELEEETREQSSAVSPHQVPFRSYSPSKSIATTQQIT